MTWVYDSRGQVKVAMSGGGGGGADGGDVIAAGTRVATSVGTVLFQSGNGVTFGLDAVNGSVMTASVNTAYAGLGSAITNGLMTFNSNGLTLNLSQLLSSQSNQALSGSNGSFTFQTASFGNLNGLSFYSSNGSIVGSYTVPTQSVQTLAASVVGNVIGTASSTWDARSLTLNAMGGISMGWSGGSLIFSAATAGGGADGLNVVGIATNTSGGTTMGVQSLQTMTTVSLIAGNGIVLSQNESGVVIQGPPMISNWVNMPAFTNTQTMLPSGSTSYCVPLDIPNQISADFLRLANSQTFTTTSFATTANTTFSGGVSHTLNFVLYSMGTGASSRSLYSVWSNSIGISQSINIAIGAGASSWSFSRGITIPNSASTAGTTFSMSSSGNSASMTFANNSFTNFSGMRWLDVPFSSSLLAGRYFLMFGISTANSTQGLDLATVNRMIFSVMAMSNINSAFGQQGVAGAAPDNNLMFGLGGFSTNVISTTSELNLAKISSQASQLVPFVSLWRHAA